MAGRLLFIDWNDERFAKASRDARLLYLGLASLADDAGCVWPSEDLKAAFFPRDEDVDGSAILQLLLELGLHGLVGLPAVPSDPLRIVHWVAPDLSKGN